MEYCELNKDVLVKKRKEYKPKNKEAIIQYNVKHDKIRRHTDPIFRLIDYNCVRIRLALQSNRKATTTIELVQCNRQFFY